MFLGRGRRSHAYTHSVQVGHHVFLNLRTLKVDVFFGESSLKITLKEVIWSRWVESREGLPGGGRHLNSLFRIFFSVQAWIWKCLMHRLLKCRSPLPRTGYPRTSLTLMMGVLQVFGSCNPSWLVMLLINVSSHSDIVMIQDPMFQHYCLVSSLWLIWSCCMTPFIHSLISLRSPLMMTLDRSLKTLGLELL